MCECNVCRNCTYGKRCMKLRQLIVICDYLESLVVGHYGKSSSCDVIVLLQVSVIRGSRDGGVTWPSHLVLHEAQDSLASPVSPRDTHSKHQALSDGDASRGEDSSGGRLHHFSQAHRDLETEFDRRRRVLQKGCKLHDAKVALPDIMWRSHSRISPHGQLTFCVTPKVRRTIIILWGHRIDEKFTLQCL